MTFRRSTRSAIAPPIGPMRPMGRNPAAATSPVHPACPVRTATRSPTATVSIHVPTFEISAAVHTSAKLRCRSGRNAAQALNSTTADELARPRAGVDAVAPDDLTGDDGRVVAVGALHEPLATGREVVAHLGQ